MYVRQSARQYTVAFLHIDSPLALKNRTRRSPPATAMTPTLGFGCHATSTTPLPAPWAVRRPTVGFWWLAFKTRCSSRLPLGRGWCDSGAMNDFVDDNKSRSEGVPAVIRLAAHAGRGCSVSNLGASEGESSWVHTAKQKKERRLTARADVFPARHH